MPNPERLITTNQERAEWTKHEKREIRQGIEDLQTVMSTPAGRRALYRFLDNNGAGLEPKDPYRYAPQSGATDVGAICLELGRWQVAHGLIRDMLSFCPEAYGQMMQEQLNEHIKRQREAGTDQKSEGPDDAME